MNPTARIIEIFSSIQGEGLFVGQSHLFVRFWDCNMACRYCDTEYRGSFQEMTASALTQTVRDHMTTEGPFHAVSLTGGEPLLWSDFLKIWLPELKKLGIQIYCETNGTLPEALLTLLPWIDFVAMDLKLPSTTADQPQWEAHERFLQTAWGGCSQTFVKMVVTADTDPQELQHGVRLVAAIDKRIPLVLQPVTMHGPVQEEPTAQQLADWRRSARRVLKDVRVIPQVHKLMGVR